MTEKKKEPDKKEIRKEDELAYTFTIWLCRIMMLISLAWFTGSFFKWYDILDSDETYRVLGAFLFALFWIILTFVVEGAFRNIGQHEGEPKADAIGFDSPDGDDNSGNPV